MDKENVVSFNFKKKKILPFATTWVNLEDIMLSELIYTGQAGKNKY